MDAAPETRLAPPRPLLLIAYEFAPSAGGGVARVLKYAKYLRRNGWEPTVLTAKPGFGRPRDETLLLEVAGVEIVRLPSLNPVWMLARLSTPLRRVLRRRPARTDERGSGGAAVRRIPLTTRVARRVMFPDESAVWADLVARTGPRLCRRIGAQAILASGPPFSTLDAAVRVGETTGIPVVLDMRDQWRDNVSIAWPTPGQKECADELERRTLSRAAAVIGATAGISREAAEMGASCVTTIPNGFDPETVPAHEPSAASPLRIAFLGRFSRGVMDPTPFFQGLALARSRDGLSRSIVVDVIGPEAPWIGGLLDELDLTGAVFYHGFRPYGEAMRLVARADVGLMTVRDDPGTSDLYPGKLSDYIGAGLTLLFVGPADGSVARLVREARAGAAVAYDDVEAIADVLVRWAAAKVAGEPLANPDPAVRASFDRRQQVAVLARVLDSVSGTPLG